MKYIKLELPKVAPFGIELYPEHAQEIWDAFVKPDQKKENPQSTEMRMLMALLRSFAKSEVIEES